MNKTDCFPDKSIYFFWLYENFSYEVSIQWNPLNIWQGKSQIQHRKLQYSINLKKIKGERNSRYSALQTSPNSWESLMNTGYEYMPWSSLTSSAGLLRGKRVFSYSLLLCSQEFCTQMIWWLFEAEQTPPRSWTPLLLVLLFLSVSRELKAGR